MANTGATGLVVDESGAGIGNLLVGAFDVEVILTDELLRNTTTLNDPLFPGMVRTDASGNYSISYPANAYGLEANPDLRVKVYDSVKRFLGQSPVFEDVTEAVKAVPDITINRADAEGYLVTLGTGTPPALSTGNRIEFLVDNESAWSRITQSVQAATSDIRLILLLWDVEDEGMITLFNPGNPPTTGTKLQEALVAAGAAPRNVNVKIVMWDVWLWPDQFPPDFTGDCENFFGGKPNVEFRRFSRSLFTPMHAKAAILRSGADTEAYLIASPFLQEYFDASTHDIDDARRGEFNWLDNQIRVPIHDVSAFIKGPAVADVDAAFRLHRDKLNQPGDAATAPVTAPAVQPDNVSIQIVRSLPGGVFTSPANGETGILEAYLRAIRESTDYIYIENQYFTEREIADALVLALKSPAKPNLQVIMVVNNKVDVPLYAPVSIIFDGWQVNLIERMLESLNDAQRDRIGLFTLWSFKADNPKPRIIRNYVHSKVGFVDDKWGTVGSANLDGVGLNTSQHYLLLDKLLFGIPDFTNERSSELNAVVYNGVSGQSATDKITQLRRRLWAEHLGFRDGTGAPDPNNANVVNRPAEGWLKRWKDAAAAKLNALKQDPPAAHQARILPFPHDRGDVPFRVDKPKRYLKALGIDIGKLKIEEASKEFSFRCGRFL